tara:strand:+ start:1391 stop:1816 length:426 start_codon:yes stop_codon:yes gene_type:complete
MDVELQIISHVMVLVFWSMLIWLWMYVTRLPAVSAAKLKPDPFAPRGQQMATLPAQVRWKADNYNHLMEQPTVFYALAISLALLGEGKDLNLYLAWSYVLLRIMHSLVQVSINKIELRFLLYLLSNIPLFWLAVEALLLII